jgi:hypothetical protein
MPRSRLIEPSRGRHGQPEPGCREEARESALQQGRTGNDCGGGEVSFLTNQSDRSKGPVTGSMASKSVQSVISLRAGFKN